MYIQVKWINEKKNVGDMSLYGWFYSLDVDWMRADLNACLQMIVKRGWGLYRLNDLRSPDICITREKPDIFTRRLSYDIFFYNYKVKKIGKN